MQYDLSAEEIRTLIARKAARLEYWAKHGISMIGDMSKEEASGLIDELATLANGLPSRPRPVEKAA